MCARGRSPNAPFFFLPRAPNRTPTARARAPPPRAGDEDARRPGGARGARSGGGRGPHGSCRGERHSGRCRGRRGARAGAAPIALWGSKNAVQVRGLLDLFARALSSTTPLAPVRPRAVLPCMAARGVLVRDGSGKQTGWAGSSSTAWDSVPRDEQATTGAAMVVGPLIPKASSTTLLKMHGHSDRPPG